MVSDGDKWVAIQNIIRFEKKLEGENNEDERRILRELIECERAKLRS